MMELKETSLGRRRKETRWSYDYFREYLISLTRGKEFLLSTDHFPNRIKLSQDWHNLLDQIRRDSQDGIERWALVGFKSDRRALYLPIVHAKGVHDHVPSEIIWQEVKKARDRAGIVGLVGDIHSHPRQLEEKIWGPFKRKKQHLAVLSPDDLYGMLIPERFFPMMVAVVGNEQIFAFKTRESTDIPFNSAFFNQESFKKYWNQRHADPWIINLGIAARHNLVLYKGKPRKDLTKVFPVPSDQSPQHKA